MFGQGTQTVVDFSRAERILSLDCDFLGIDATGSASDFSRKRQGGGEDYREDVAADAMNRLYMVESAFSLTGGMADHRMRAKPSQMAAVAAQVATALGVKVEVGYLELTEQNLGVTISRVDLVVKILTRVEHILSLIVVEDTRRLIVKIQHKHLLMKTLILFLEQEMLYKMI